VASFFLFLNVVGLYGPVCIASLQKGGTPSRQERKEQQMKGESFASLRAILGFFSVDSCIAQKIVPMMRQKGIKRCMIGHSLAESWRLITGGGCHGKRFAVALNHRLFVGRPCTFEAGSLIFGEKLYKVCAG
jgi:hypothetical protein